MYNIHTMFGRVRQVKLLLHISSSTRKGKTMAEKHVLNIEQLNKAELLNLVAAYAVAYEQQARLVQEQWDSLRKQAVARRNLESRLHEAMDIHRSMQAFIDMGARVKR